MTHEIRTLKDGEKITEPGFYRIPLDQHHSQPCDGVSVTSGILRAMDSQTPEDVWAFHQLNENTEPTPLAPKKYVREETDALRLGAAMAAFIEDGIDGLKELYKILPPDKPNRPTPVQMEKWGPYIGKKLGDLFMTIPEDAPRRPTKAQLAALDAGKPVSDTAQESIRFWAAVENDPREVIKPADLESLRKGLTSISFWQNVDADPRRELSDTELRLLSEMGEVLVANDMARLALSGEPEITMAYKHEPSGLWVLSRPDNVTFDGQTADYKKVSTQGRAFTTSLCDRRIEEHGYDMQMALAGEALEQLGVGWPTAVGLVFQKDKPPYSVILRDLLEEDLQIARWRNHSAIMRFAECLDSGRWPGPGEHVTAYQMPDWKREKYLELMNVEGKAP
ncbi:MAG: PD-(D/E)XK nuclease-like domain-containing protein [Vannielia sp.]|uniref:hypothetical protein n=1 Tax=Vannielia sp. TaxID=2813045 RepID=UPI003B8DCBFC